VSESAILPIVLFLPLAGALLLLLIPKEEEGLLRGAAIGISLATFLVSLALLPAFDNGFGGFQIVFDREWIKSLGVHFKLGVDGISLWLVILTTFLVPIVLLSARRAIQKKVKEFLIAFLILEVGMIGAFVALDLFLFYVMWEVMLIPMYFIIGIWGGERRVYASIKFVIFTMVGSLLMLVAIFFLYSKYQDAGGTATFDLEAMYSLQLSKSSQIWCFLAFALAFAIKVPLFPLHTWLPDAHVEAPTSGSVILAGVLLKFGIYGFLRFAIPLFPYASRQLAPYIMALAVIGVVYGAVVAYAQEDVKKLVAYSSVSHLGFCVIGAFALNVQGMEGAIFAMLSHGLTTSGLFLAIGVLYERRHTRKMSEYGGVWAKMPVFAAFFLICTLGSAALPGLSGFVGEFLSLAGTYDIARTARDYIAFPQVYAVVAATGVILGAVYLLTMFQKVMFGPVSNPKNQNLKDLSFREIVVFLPIVVGVFVMGLYPRPFLATMEKSVEQLRKVYDAKVKTATDEAAIVAIPKPAPTTTVVEVPEGVDLPPTVLPPGAPTAPRPRPAGLPGAPTPGGGPIVPGGAP
jgi:NADH-quinone oxidoreductase subunit M